MYKIIGADSVQYGPITVEQLRQWIGEGRVNAQTMVQPVDGGEWKPLSAYPELASLAPPAAPVFSPSPLHPVTPAVSAADAAAQVQGPAIGLLVTALLGLILALVSLGMHALGLTFHPQVPAGNEPLEEFVNLTMSSVGMIQGLVQLVVSVVILLGAMKMMKLQRYQFAVTSSILALLPCVSPCCLVGLPVGIWALVVLMKPEVKSAFN